MGVLDKLNQIKSCKENIKQAIEDKGVDMTDVAFTDYATKISEIQAGGGSGDYVELRNSLTTYSNSNLTEVPDYTFAGCPDLTTVNLPNCTCVGNNAFHNADSLTTVDLPKCEEIRGGAYSDCNSLTTVNLPKCIKVGDDAFAYDNISSLNLPVCEEISGNAFTSNKVLTSLDLPKCKKISYYAFQYCSSLQSANLPVCEEIRDSAFNNTALLSIDLPMCRKMGDSVFCDCHPLQTANLPKVAALQWECFCRDENLTSVYIPRCLHIADSVFSGCNSLTELNLSETYYCSLQDTNSFDDTPLMNGEGSIYVHISALPLFQNDTNWSMFADRFVGVGDASKPLLIFDNGKVSGYTSSMQNNYLDVLGISREDVTTIELYNLEEIYRNDWGEGLYFDSYSNLQEVNLPKCEYVGRRSFYSCPALTTIDLPECITLMDEAFQYCRALTTVNLPKCEYVGNTAFYDCSLTSVNLPNCTIVGHYAFCSCPALTTIDLPKCERVEHDAFLYCYALTTVNLPMCSYIGENALHAGFDIETGYGIENKVIYIGTSLSTVCELKWGNEAFLSNATIYVPAALVDEYKSDVSWGQFADRIVGI
jgi:hypothetical protein